MVVIVKAVKASVGSRGNTCTAIQVYHAIDNSKIEVFRNNEHVVTPNIATNFVNITNIQNNKATLDTKTFNNTLQKPSQPSQPSLQGIVQSIYRIRDTDTWACKNCKQRDDKWYMQKHMCSGKR